jgi:hypothetical protein
MEISFVAALPEDQQPSQEASYGLSRPELPPNPEPLLLAAAENEIWQRDHTYPTKRYPIQVACQALNRSRQIGVSHTNSSPCWPDLVTLPKKGAIPNGSRIVQQSPRPKIYRRRLSNANVGVVR